MLIVFICSINKDTFADENIPIETQVYINQLEEKNNLFKDALNKFGALSKEEAVDLYAQGVKIRSGALQYSVMCKELKIRFEEEMDKNKNYAWVTGTSSPWVSEYKIYEYRYLGKDTYSVLVKFILNDAKGAIGKSVVNLEVKKCNNIWCISKINEM